MARPHLGVNPLTFLQILPLALGESALPTARSKRLLNFGIKSKHTDGKSDFIKDVLKAQRKVRKKEDARKKSAEKANKEAARETLVKRRKNKDIAKDQHIDKIRERGIFLFTEEIPFFSSGHDPLIVLKELEVTHRLDKSDNYRVARLDKLKEVKAYIKKRDRGCCGNFDVLVDIGGYRYIVGCNYGH